MTKMTMPKPLVLLCSVPPPSVLPHCAAAAGQKRVFDFSKFEQRSVVLQLMYVGWSYQGYARQADTDNTIEVCRVVLQTLLFRNASLVSAVGIQVCDSSGRVGGCANPKTLFRPSPDAKHLWTQQADTDNTMCVYWWPYTIPQPRALACNMYEHSRLTPITLSRYTAAGAG
jgi:hypothetical protein